ncbi:hypothetical protein RMSM_00139 [Rhodopirellula maiorica SM1]|uniref:Uncharacterized protein n=1 Tax=Rhodopirellula maiorica SM1 TaxID=1265738 RepID=M5RUG4_9BACT|nr:hypothetical protein RMSM_00139 [Rhodopirellula maiorica SM1]
MTIQIVLIAERLATITSEVFPRVETTIPRHRVADHCGDPWDAPSFVRRTR